MSTTNKSRARLILNRVWGDGNQELRPSEAEWLHEQSKGNETSIEIALRLSEVAVDWQSIEDWDARRKAVAHALATTP